MPFLADSEFVCRCASCAAQCSPSVTSCSPLEGKTLGCTVSRLRCLALHSLDLILAFALCCLKRCFPSRSGVHPHALELFQSLPSLQADLEPHHYYGDTHHIPCFRHITPSATTQPSRNPLLNPAPHLPPYPHQDPAPAPPRHSRAPPLISQLQRMIKTQYRCWTVL